MPRDPTGYFSLLLHAHLPYVRHPEHDRFLEERWFFEALTESYVPLLATFDQLVKDRVNFRVSWSVSPTLLAMLSDELLKDRYQRHLALVIELAEREIARNHAHPEFRSTAEFYFERLQVISALYSDVYQRDLVAALRRLEDEGRLEILTCAATHGFLPLLSDEPASVRAQVEVALEQHREHFGRQPRGIWLPECGFYPGLDQVLADAGLRYFCLDSHGILNGKTRARYGVHAPVACPSGIAAFGRDPECSQQVWSAEEGFPADPDYREFYRDVGFDLPLEYVGPYIGPDGVRTSTGIKYHRITGATDRKAPYDRRQALTRARVHALEFRRWREEQAGGLAAHMDRTPFVLAPYDAELFGHWWYEGPEWLNFLLRELAADECSVTSVTPSDYLAEYPSAQVSMPSASSWGHQGYFDMWLNEENDWIYPALLRAAREMTRLAGRYPSASGVRRKALNQAARELLLAQASDWSFILRTGTSTGYASRRVREHLDNFHRLADSIREGRIETRLLGDLEENSALFPDLSYRAFREVSVESVPRDRMHVAFIVAEMSPLVKVGGLADVAGALPAALAAEGARVSILLPAYRSIDVEKHGIRQRAAGLSVPMGPESRGFSVLEAADTPPGVRLYLIEQEAYFGRDGVYVDPRTKEEYPDTAERFTFFTRAALEALRALGDRVDVVHCHDHQTALAPAHLKIHYRDDPVLGAAASVYTLHNLGYQGIHPPEILDLAGFGRGQCYPGSYFEYYGKVNFMKVGICFADKVSTVSEKYAREICRDEVQSAGLAPVIQTRAQDLVGIINGIDEEEWNPAKDPHLPRGFDAEDLGGKRECKSALLKVAGLDPAGLDRPLLGMVSRLVEQKGLDLVEEAFPEILERGVYFVVLGTGIPRYEKFFRDAAAENPGKVAALIKFDNSLAHLAEAGLDLFLMPSLYEPCGLNQMYSLRYGTVPVVRATGGLADTVSDADSGAEGVGFTFREYRARDLLEALDRALEAYRDPRRWRAIQRRGMARDSSWTASARKYLSLYRQAVESRTAG